MDVGHSSIRQHVVSHKGGVPKGCRNAGGRVISSWITRDS